MGLLDDAIREHLDLKRRRGADPTEVERSEREALGPVRRTPERVPGDESELDVAESELDVDAGSEAGAAPGAVYDDGLVGHDEPGAAAFAPDERASREPEPAAAYEPEPAAYEPEPAYEPVEPHPEPLDHSTLPGRVGVEEEPSWSYDESAAAEPERRPQDEAVPPPHRADSGLLDDDSDHTTEFDVEAALGAEEPPLAHDPAHSAPAAAPEDEDVLEETPEFLQDTPDHDRLWFEQRPPKDFDFDG